MALANWCWGAWPLWAGCWASTLPRLGRVILLKVSLSLLGTNLCLWDWRGECDLQRSASAWNSSYRWSQLCVPAGICPSLFLQGSFPKVPILALPLPISVYRLHIREYEPLFFKSILKIAKHTCGFHLAFSGRFYTLAEWSLVNILVLLVHGWYKMAPLLGAVVQTSWWPGSSS